MRTKKMEHRFLRAVQGILGYVLALLLALSLTAACGVALVNRLLTDQALHERVARDERVLKAQAERIEETVQELAEEYHFTPELALDMIDQESLGAYGSQMVAWWMQLIKEHPDLETPFPDTSVLEGAVRADELFRENTEDVMRQTIARDQIGYPIGLAMREAVIPLRVSLIALGIPEVAERVNIPRMIGLLGTAQTALFALSAGMLILVLLTQGKRRCLFASAGLMAAFILLAAVTVVAAVAGLPAAMAEYSSLLALQLSVLLGKLAVSALLTEGVILLAAVLLLSPMLLKRKEVYHGRHERKAA